VSDNKFKYFEVNTTTVVKALNKTDAVKAAASTKRVPGTEVLDTWADVDRISAVQARELINLS